MPNIGPMELIIVLALALLILGPKRLPGAGKALGQGMREFRDGITGHHNPSLPPPDGSPPPPDTNAPTTHDHA